MGAKKRNKSECSKGSEEIPPLLLLFVLGKQSAIPCVRPRPASRAGLFYRKPLFAGQLQGTYADKSVGSSHAQVCLSVGLQGAGSQVVVHGKFLHSKHLEGRMGGRRGEPAQSKRQDRATGRARGRISASRPVSVYAASVLEYLGAVCRAVPANGKKCSCGTERTCPTGCRQRYARQVPNQGASDGRERCQRRRYRLSGYAPDR